MDTIFQLTLEDFLRISISAIFIFLFTIVIIRLLGKRSVSKFNHFDWVVTLAVASILASTIVNKNISILEGALGITCLFFLQYLTTKAIFYSKTFCRLLKPAPTLLFIEGKFIEANLEKERIHKEEIYASLRLEGLKSFDSVYAVVLETNSKISLIRHSETETEALSLRGVAGLPESTKQLKPPLNHGK